MSDSDRAGVRVCDREPVCMKEEETGRKVGVGLGGGYSPRYHQMKSKFHLALYVNKPVGESLFSS